jgi:N-methylhydantoinase A
MKRVSVDVGGTFTDCFVVYDDKQVEAKALTTHHNLAIGFMNALEQAVDELDLPDVNALLSEVESVRYATTLGTNALITRSGRAVALLVTAGYESAVPLSRGKGYGVGMSPLYKVDIAGASRPVPLVPIPLIRGVKERLDYKGEVLMKLDEDHLRRQIRDLVDRGAQAFVVALVNSVVNPEHERRVEEIILEEFPSHMLGAIPVILSHLVGGRKGEYVRATSAIVDAYLHDQMYFALNALGAMLREGGYKRSMLVVHNTGGMAEVNSTHALQTIHSGPVAGVNASEHLANEYGLDNIVTTDMGGTSFDIGLVVKGGVKFYDFNPVMDRWMVNVPMIHLVTLGAGGGSIAHFDRMFKTIEVGPASAGSDPGPACYDRGGTLPTVTDADLMLGYLDPAFYAGGKVKLNRRRAEFAVRDTLCDQTGLTEIEIAKFIKRRIDANMSNAIAEELGTKGYDPKNFTLLAYGGSGPLHCCGIAQALKINKVFVPPFSSVFSALGAGNMHQMHVHERSVYMWIYNARTGRLLTDYSTINGLVEELETLGKEDLMRQGFDEDAISYTLEMDMRYGNQLAETSVTSPHLRLNSVEDMMALINMFSEDYGKRYGAGSQAPEAGIRINTIRVQSSVELTTIPLERPLDGANTKVLSPVRTRACHFPGRDEALDTAVFAAGDLLLGSVIKGPAVIESSGTTCLIEPGWTMTVGPQGSGWITRDEINAERPRQSSATRAEVHSGMMGRSGI